MKTYLVSGQVYNNNTTPPVKLAAAYGVGNKKPKESLKVDITWDTINDVLDTYGNLFNDPMVPMTAFYTYTVGDTCTAVFGADSFTQGQDELNLSLYLDYMGLGV